MIRRSTMLLVLWLLALSATGHAERSAAEVIRAIIDNQRGERGRVTMTMTVQRAGRTAEYVIDALSDGHARSLIRVLAPAREAGQAFLIDGDNLWLYNPRLGRTLRLPPSGRGDSFLGSDIAYSDLAGRDLETDYDAEVSAEDQSHITLTLTPRPGAPTPYGKIVVTADAATYAPLRFVYYDQRDQPVRQIDFADLVAVGGRYVPTRIAVVNLLRESERTTVTLSNLQWGITVPEACFRESALERGCP